MEMRDSFFARPGGMRLLGLVAGAVGLALGAAVPAVHAGLDAVSYTHLDVYKRQAYHVLPKEG